MQNKAKDSGPGTSPEEPRQYPVWAVLTFTGVVTALLTVGDLLLRPHPVAGRICLFLAGGCLLALLIGTGISELVHKDTNAGDPAPK